MYKSQKELVDYLIKVGDKKANRNRLRRMILSFFGGVFIALGGLGNIIVSADLIKVNEGLAKLIGASVFPVGLMLIIMLGYELFTSNCMMIVGAIEGKYTYYKMTKNLGLALLFNFFGALFIAFIVVKTGTLNANGKDLIISIASHKVHATAFDIFLKAIICNILVCGASLLAYGSKSAVSQIFGIWFPIMLFVVIGYDHVVANMFYLPAAFMLKANISILEILNNFIFSTIGNFVGGAIFLALPFYYAVKNMGKKN